jgi:glycine/D-amino acid oxidase-like deaminating enzyme
VWSSVPLWQDEPYTPRPALRGAVDADVCVIGAGAGGLATAWHLATRGASVAMLEAREVASGASGRNGGFFIAGPAPMYHEAVARWGRERAVAIQHATLDAQREMLGVAVAIRARSHFRMMGMLRVGMDAAEADDVRAHQAALARDGFAGEVVAGADLPPPLAREDRLGLYLDHDGGVHPVRWLRMLAAALEREHGTRIFEGTRVTSAPRVDGAGVVVTAADGATVRCARAVVAMDGGLAALLPAASAVRPRRLNMLATEPVPTVIDCPVYARHGYEYVHQTPDGRIALGGFSDLDGAASWTDRESVSEPVQARLDRYLAEELGVADARVTHRWAGVVGYAEDPLPRAGALPDSDGRVLALGGYNGTGHVQSWAAARTVAAQALGEPAETPYAPW